MTILLFVMVVLTMAAQLADYFTTIRGMDKGLVESNRLNRWLFSKLGLPLTTFIEAGIILGLTALFGTYSLTAANVFCVVVVAEKLTAVVHNIRLIRAHRS